MRPDEKFAYEEEALKEIQARFYGMEIVPSLPGLPNSGKYLADILRKPWGGETFWKHRYQGNCEELFFITKMSKVPGFVDAMLVAAGRNGFPISDVGCYVQPIDNGRACHLEFDLFYDRQDKSQVDMVKALVRDAAKIMLLQGAFFARPYGEISDLVYSKTTNYTAVLKKVKGMFDPNNILNPGNLYF